MTSLSGEFDSLEEFEATFGETARLDGEFDGDVSLEGSE